MSYKDGEWINAGHKDWCRVSLSAQGLHWAVNAPASQLMPFDQACDYNAQRLYEDWQAWSLYLSFSGGMDSDLVANVLHRNQIPFTVVILEIGECNQQETWYAHYWCWKNNVVPQVIKMDLWTYERNILPMLNKLRHTHQHGSTVNLWLSQHISSLGGKMITGLGDINFDFGTKTFFNDVIDWAPQLFGNEDQPCGFFSYTAELVASYINTFDTDISEQYNKARFYNIDARPKIPSIMHFAKSTPFTEMIMKKFTDRNPKKDPNWIGNKEQTLSLVYKNHNITA